MLAPGEDAAGRDQLLNAELNKLIAKPAIVTRFQELGAEPMGGTPEHAAAFIKAEQEKWGKVIRDVGIKAE